MKVWHDWDSGPYETISDKPLLYIKAVESEMTEEEYLEYEQVLARYTEWQKRLRKMRKREGK
jgi:hypothetical protein